MVHKTYTQEEIASILNILKNEEENLLAYRKKLDQDIRNKRKNIKKFEEMDLRQYKMF